MLAGDKAAKNGIKEIDLNEVFCSSQSGFNFTYLTETDLMRRSLFCLVN